MDEVPPKKPAGDPKKLPKSGILNAPLTLRGWGTIRLNLKLKKVS